MDPDGFGYGVVSGKKGEAEGWFGSWLKDCPSDPSSLPGLPSQLLPGVLPRRCSPWLKREVRLS